MTTIIEIKRLIVRSWKSAIVTCLSLALLCSCTPDHTKQVAIPNTEIKHITAAANKVPYKLFISLPEGYHSKGHNSYRESYPVLYLLDPDVEFGLAENIARTMVNYDNIEPFIIVGIGYQDQDLSTMDSKTFWDKWTQNRARDYIPIQVSAGREDFEGGDHEYKGLSAHTGGSEKFKDFIEKELIPYIDSSYRTSNERALSGHSQGGLFTTWMMLNHPSVFEKYIILGPSLWVEKGQQWLDDLPRLITQVEATYGLLNLKQVEALSYNYVLTGFQGAKAVILKLGLDIDGFKREAAALMAFSGFGVVEVLSANNGLLLLECAVPGVSLKSHFPENDDEAINITANVIKRLHQAPIPSPHPFPHVKDPGYAGGFAEASWLAALDKEWNIPHKYLQKARKLRDQLLKTAASDVLLHGDLHHDNILQNGNDKSRRSSQSEDGWLVIDPKGVIGESAYEVAAFIRNPMPELLNHDDAKNIIHNRITHFAEALELSSQRILDWCFVQAVLSWAWSLEDNLDPEYYKRFIGMIHKQ